MFGEQSALEPHDEDEPDRQRRDGEVMQDDGELLEILFGQDGHVRAVSRSLGGLSTRCGKVPLKRPTHPAPEPPE